MEPDPRPITVVVADDHELFRRGMQTVLAMEAGFDVLAQAADGEEAVAKVAELAPDVVLMDVRMPRVDGIEAARRIRESTPSTRVVMLTISDEEDDLYGAVRAGANGYLLKDSSLEDVADAVRAVARGESLISPSMASKLLAEFTAVTGGAGPGEEVDEGAPRLSPREIEVLKLVAQGHTNREVAAALHLSENTVKNHVANILDKLHLRSRLEAVMYAMRMKLLELP
ncbi:MAG TPA: response regulator transcription factor [Acidimicrobiales bacterium]|nr:response regulator transcription factor [Acidimicrobiales bacterium]